MHRTLGSLDEAIEMTELANTDAKDIMYVLKNQREKLENIENKNRITNGLLRTADNLTLRILKRKNVISIVTLMLVVAMLTCYIGYKMYGM